MSNTPKASIPQESNNLLQELIEATEDLIAALDEHHAILSVSSAFSRFYSNLYGHSIRPGEKFLDHMPHEARQQWERIIEQALTTDRQGFEQRYVIEEKRLDIEWSASKVGIGDGASGIALVGRDITARRMAEETLREQDAQLHHSQKMEAVGTLAGGVAHEFNNALSIVLGSLELAEMDIQAEQPGRSYLDDAKSGILRAKKVVRQLLDFSRKSDGQPQEVMLDAIAGRALSLLRASIPTHIEFHQIIDKCPPVMGDPSHMHQMIVNLCTNAADAMDREGGVLTVTLEQVRLHAKRLPDGVNLDPGPYAKLTVADNGRGIDPENLARIFEPLYTTKGPDRGTGMGLAVVQGIVKTHEGDITVQSRPGAGTKFEVFLPTRRETRALPAAVNTAALTGNERILFVDDETKFLIITQRQLEYLGYRLEVHTSPVRALDRFREAPDKFDLVISDVAMPKMTGEMLINQIRQIRPTIPAILLTGYSEKVDKQTADSIGCEYAIKPIERNDLAGLVRKAIDGGSTP